MSRLLVALPLLLVPSLALADEPDEPATPVEPAPAPAPDPAAETPEPPPVEPAVTIDVESARLSGASIGESLAIDGSMRSYASSWLIMPYGWETSGELRFLTANAPPGGEPMRMTDVVITRVSARKSLRGKAELAVGLDALPKQPSDTSELAIQGLDLGARVGFKRKYAAYLGGAAGPLTNDQGWWASAGAGVQRRSKVHETLSFQLAAGASLTPLLPDEGERAWLGEAVVRGQTLFMAEDMFGIWLGADFAFPVAHGGDLMGAELDPQPRVDVAVGAVYSVVDDWDVYMELGLVDRGDLDAPATQLPILQGGSDQRVLIFGVTRQFGEADANDDMYLAY